MKLVTGDEMEKIDRQTQTEYGISGLVLMEQAGERVTAFLLEMFSPKTRYVILAGAGKNGGDALVVARRLFLAGIRVQVYVVGKTEDLAEPTLKNLSIFEKIGGLYELVQKVTGTLRRELRLCDVVIDGLIGIGQKGSLREPYSDLVAAVNSSEAKVVSIDIPTGVDAQTGEVFGGAVHSDYTITFGLPKLGQYLFPGADYAGEIFVEPLSFPPALLNSDTIKANLITRSDIRAVIRPKDSHKGTYGKGLLVAGSPKMSGAAFLAAKAALRVGAGLVEALIPEEIAIPMQSLLPEATLKFPGDSLDLSEYAGFMIGPGWGVFEANAAILRELIRAAEEHNKPVVLDADALNLVARYELLKKGVHGSLILTPHPGEMGRLVGSSVKEVNDARIKTALSYAKKIGATVVLKGAHTVVAMGNGSFYINPTGNAGMATAGSGDVLTGIIGGLLLQGLSCKDAAVTGVYIHGLAGDLAKKELGPDALIATDLIDYIPRALVDIH